MYIDIDMPVELDNQLKGLISALLENGELFFPNPLVGVPIYQLKKEGFLVEKILPTGFRYSLSDECKEYFAANPELLEEDYAYLNSDTDADFGFL